MNRWIDGGEPIWLLNWNPKLYFSHKRPTQKFISQDLMHAISARKTGGTPSFVSHKRFLGHFVNFEPKKVKTS